MQSEIPTFFVVAGSNGAGKSTHSRDLLPDNMEGIPIHDFDIQFNELKKQFVEDGLPSKDAIIKANEQVNTWFNDLRVNAMQSRVSFAYEGHFTGGSHWQPLLEAKQQGYHVHMIFMGLKNVEASISRVNKRVKAGGHFVSEQQAKLNYFGNMDMLDRNLKLPHKIDVYQNDKALDHVCTLEHGIVVKVAERIPEWIKREMPELNKLIEDHLNRKKISSRKLADEKSGQIKSKL